MKQIKDLLETEGPELTKWLLRPEAQTTINNVVASVEFIMVRYLKVELICDQIDAHKKERDETDPE